LLAAVASLPTRLPIPPVQQWTARLRQPTLRVMLLVPQLTPLAPRWMPLARLLRARQLPLPTLLLALPTPRPVPPMRLLVPLPTLLALPLTLPAPPWRTPVTP
jgi:hypothetical protein